MSAPRVLVFQHAAFCPLGTFGEFLAEDGIEPRIVELHNGDKIPNLEPFDALIALGGPMEVWETEAHPWLNPEKAAILQWVSDFDRPMLGICLGHQLLADTLGGEVRPAKSPEAGVGDIRFTNEGKVHPLLKGFEVSKRAINFHGSEVTRLPAGGVRLASTSDCQNAAFQTGSAAFGIQYHAEANSPLVDQWTDLPAGKALAQKLHGEDGATRVRNGVAEAMPELKDNAKRLYRNFIAIARNGRG